MAILPSVTPGTGHFGRSSGIPRAAYLANDLTTQSSQALKRIGAVGSSKIEAEDQVLGNEEIQPDFNSSKEVLNRRLTQQAAEAKYVA